MYEITTGTRLEVYPNVYKREDTTKKIGTQTSYKVGKCKHTEIISGWDR